jgi:hypothetical protein
VNMGVNECIGLPTINKLTPQGKIRFLEQTRAESS